MALQAHLSLVQLDQNGVNQVFRDEVLRGLSEPQKAVPARWFYDLEGSRLFEQITQLPEYYPTRTETMLLRQYGEEIARLVGSDRSIVEFGSGSSVKTPILLNAIRPRAYVPLDISGEFLREASAGLARDFPELPIVPVEADFMRPVRLPLSVSDHALLGFFPGSTIGNMVPRTAVDLLRTMRETLGADAKLLIGVDRLKDVGRMIVAYDDAQGVTARFNLNLLDRINKELDGDIPGDRFRHVARWNGSWSRIEIHLEATIDLNFAVSGREFTMHRGETIHTENSHKYTPDQAQLLLQASGWTPDQLWSDEEGDFMLIGATATGHRSAP